MKIKGLHDDDEMIKINDLKEVTTQQIYRSQNVWHPQGLFSEEIFGQTVEERKYRCGYIKLPIHVFNPTIAKDIISRGGGIIRKMAYGEARCNLVDGVLVPATEGKYCGLKDLYDIWEKIDIEKTLKNSRSTDNILILTKTPKRLLFTDKVIVLPPEMRPVGTKNGKFTKSELTTLYSKILGLKSVTAHTTMTNVYKLYSKFQDSVIEIYAYINSVVGGKTGYLQKNLLAKTTVGTVRNVISAPLYNTDAPHVGVFETGYPLHAVVSMFKPIVQFHMRQFFSFSHIQAIHPNPGEVNSAELANIYDNKMIEDLTKIYMKNPGSRFMKLYLDAEKTKPILFEGYDELNKQKVVRHLTLTDVIYLCCYDAVVVPKRKAYLVRFPIGDHLGAFFTDIFILSTTRTTEMKFEERVYDSYPVVDPELPHSVVSTSFAETVNPSNSRLKAIGGDYDGDTVKSVGLWSEEANKRAEELMYAKIYNVKFDCSPIYFIDLSSVNGLYALSKRRSM